MPRGPQALPKFLAKLFVSAVPEGLQDLDQQETHTFLPARTMELTPESL